MFSKRLRAITGFQRERLTAIGVTVGRIEPIVAHPSTQTRQALAQAPEVSIAQGRREEVA